MIEAALIAVWDICALYVVTKAIRHAIRWLIYMVECADEREDENEA